MRSSRTIVFDSCEFRPVAGSLRLNRLLARVSGCCLSRPFFFGGGVMPIGVVLGVPLFAVPILKTVSLRWNTDSMYFKVTLPSSLLAEFVSDVCNCIAKLHALLGHMLENNGKYLPVLLLRSECA